MTDSGKSGHWYSHGVLPPCLHPDGTRKLTFRSAAKARQRATKFKPRGQRAEKLRVYQCPKCGLWHLTGRPA